MASALPDVNGALPAMEKLEAVGGGDDDNLLPAAYQAMEDRARQLVTGGPPLDRCTISFHLMEICGGTGGLSRVAGAKGLTVGPNVELKRGMDVLDLALGSAGGRS